METESLFGNYEGRCGEGFWLWPRRSGRAQRPAAGCKERANAGHGQKTRRPEGFRGKGCLASLLLSRRSTRDILVRRASPSGLCCENSAPRSFQTGSKLVACFLPLLLAGESALAAEVSFRNDVMAVLSKAGCSAGICHGNKNGKGGYKLSLRSQEPELDYGTLTRESYGRRTNPLEPDQSLVLLKATAEVAHEGGLRLKKSSAEYEILRRWIAEGIPNYLASAPKLRRLEVTPTEKVLADPIRELQLRARAIFADGAGRDVTTLAGSEPATVLATVSPAGP